MSTIKGTRSIKLKEDTTVVNFDSSGGVFGTFEASICRRTLVAEVARSQWAVLQTNTLLDRGNPVTINLKTDGSAIHHNTEYPLGSEIKGTLKAGRHCRRR